MYAAHSAQTISGNKTLLIPPSLEEEDQLTRSSKKIKNVTGEPVENIEEQWPKLGAKETKFSKGSSSFADKLKGVTRDEAVDSVKETEVSANGMSDDSMSDGEEDYLCKIVEDPNRNFPTFIFSKKMKKRMYKAWHNSVIIKLLGRNIGYKALEARVQMLWAKKGVTKLINIGHGFYVVKLSNREDYLNALTGGPWMIYDHYLVVRPWEPRFNSASAKIDKVAVWVRFPRIFLEYYDQDALAFIGDRIGEIVKVDINTSCQLRGHYARLCVLVDLTKQLMSGFSVEGQEYFVEYEGLHLLCSNCGIFGHCKELCPQVKQKQDHPGCSNQVNETSNQVGKDDQNLNKDSDGLWKVVNKPRRPRKSKEKQSEEAKHQVKGSRFALLADEEIVEQQHRVETDVGTDRGVIPDTSIVNKGTTKVCRKGEGKADGEGQMSSAPVDAQKSLVVIEGKPAKNRRVEKRLREIGGGMPAQKSETLCITMGEAQGEGINNVKEQEICIENNGLKSPIDAIPGPYDPGANPLNSPHMVQDPIGPSLASPSPGYLEDFMLSEDTIVPESQLD